MSAITILKLLLGCHNVALSLGVILVRTSIVIAAAFIAALWGRRRGVTWNDAVLRSALVATAGVALLPIESASTSIATIPVPPMFPLLGLLVIGMAIGWVGSRIGWRYAGLGAGLLVSLWALSMMVGVPCGSNCGSAPTSPFRITIQAAPLPILQPAVEPLKSTAGQPATVPAPSATGGLGWDSTSDATPVVARSDVFGSAPAVAPPAYPYIAIVGVWIVGAAAQALWFLFCHLSLVRLRRSSRPVDRADAAESLYLLTSQKVRPPALRVSRLVSSPFLAGVIRPVIYLPEVLAADLAPSQLRVVLAHEVAHWRRRDNAWTFARRIVSMVLWFNPLVHLLARRMEDVAEECCDAEVLATGARSDEYAGVILDVAERFMSTKCEAAFGAGVASRGSFLKRRIESILAGRLSQKKLSVAVRAWIVATLAIIMAVAASVLAVTTTTDTLKPWNAPPSYLAHFRVGSGMAISPVLFVPGSDVPNLSFESTLSSSVMRPMPHNPLRLPTLSTVDARVIDRTEGAVLDIGSEFSAREQMTDYVDQKLPSAEILSASRFASEQRSKTDQDLRAATDDAVTAKEARGRSRFRFDNIRAAMLLARGDVDGAGALFKKAVDEAPCIAVGRIQHGDGTPIANRLFDFAINYYSDQPMSPKYAMYNENVYARTDADGRYALPLYRSVFNMAGWNQITGGREGNMLPNDFNTALCVIANRAGVMPPIVSRPPIVITSRQQSWTDNNSPKAAPGSTMALTWKAVPNATSYRLSLFESGIPKNGISTGGYGYGGSTSLPATGTSMTLPLTTATPLFDRDAVYGAQIVALDKDGQYAASNYFYFTVPKALAPLPATAKALAPYAPPGVRIESVTRKGAQTVVRFGYPDSYNNNDRPLTDFEHKEWFGLTYDIQSRDIGSIAVPEVEASYGGLQ